MKGFLLILSSVLITTVNAQVECKYSGPAPPKDVGSEACCDEIKLWVANDNSADVCSIPGKSNGGLYCGEIAVQIYNETPETFRNFPYPECYLSIFEMNVDVCGQAEIFQLDYNSQT